MRESQKAVVTPSHEKNVISDIFTPFLIPDSFQTETNYGKLRGSIFRWSIVHGKADPS